jgi:cell division protein FtsA
VLFPRRTPRKRPSEGAFASILDLGTTSIKALVCEMRPGEATVLGVGREALGERGTLTPRGEFALSPEVLASLCDLALRHAEDMTLGIYGHKVVADQIVMGLGGDILCAFPTTIQIKRVKPDTRITEDELVSLLQRAQRLSARQLTDHPKSREQYGRGDWALTNAMVTEVLVDGVRVVDPLRFQGKNLQVTVFSVFAPDTYQRVLASLAADLDLKLMRLVAEPFALACALPVGDALFLDVGGDRTDVALVRQGTPVALASFPQGSRTLTRQIAARLGLPFVRAEALKLRRPAAGALPANVDGEPAGGTPPGAGPDGNGSPRRVGQWPLPVPSDPLADAIASFLTTWLDGLEVVLAGMAGHESLPSRLLLAGGGSQLPELTTALGRQAWSRRLPFGRAPEVENLPPREVRGLVDRTQRLIGPQDIPGMCLARLSAAVDYPETLQDRLLKTVIGSSALPFRR